MQPALRSPGRRPLSFAALAEQSELFRHVLARLGVAPGDRVAMLMPNGPRTAATFLGVLSHAACAPLNPAYKRAELEFYFQDIQPKALLIDPALPSVAEEVAREAKIPVLHIVERADAAAGQVELPPVQTSGALASPGAQDVALILHTSGTTSRPKMVPLTQANLMASAKHIAETLRLSFEDSCLNAMPLFHIHGLIAGVLAPVLSGGSALCPTLFDARLALDWLAADQPSWMTAVPTMYEALAITAAARASESPIKHRLRFMRSSSASLAPRLMSTLEQLFDVPMIEAYGMTEAAHQMASNPLPPLARKPGSVGLAAGPEVAIMDSQSNALLPTGSTGEIVIRGVNVTAGYMNNASANAANWTDGWFRTGDQGHLDADGYLFISGRLKELINRGGEKISPREIDETILGIDGVQQVVTFAIPHKTLGEDIAVAAVLKPGASVTESNVRDHVGARLAAFKVPARVLFVPEIPKGPTGKLQRIGLAEKLAHLLDEAYVAPRSPVEQQLVEIWQQTLGIPRASVRSNFFSLGGDSLAAVRIASEAARRGLSLPVTLLLRELTIERIAPHVVPLQISRVEGETALGTVPLHGFQHLLLFPSGKYPEAISSPTEIVFALKGPVNRAALITAVRALAKTHDAFGLCYFKDRAYFHQRQELALITDADVDAIVHDTTPETFDSAVKALHRTYDLTKPPLFRVMVSRGNPGKFALIAHHAVADALSMQILAEDIASAYDQADAGRPVVLPSVPTPMAAYVRRYDAAARAGRWKSDLPLWLDPYRTAIPTDPEPLLPGVAQPVAFNTVKHREINFGADTERVLAYAREQRVAPSELLLMATAAGVARLVPSQQARIMLLHNGRDDASFGDVSRTVGCLTTILPFRVDLPAEETSVQKLARVQRALRELPSGGVSISAVIENEPVETNLQVVTQYWYARIMFNYKGTLGTRSASPVQSGRLQALPPTYAPPDMMEQVHHGDDDVPGCLGLQLHFEIARGVLYGDLYFSPSCYTPEQIDQLVSDVRHSLASLPVAK